MGVWMKVTGEDPGLSWARGLSAKHNALRDEFGGGFYAMFAGSHVHSTVKGFRSWKLRVDILDGPPSQTRVAPQQNKPTIHRLKNPRRTYGTAFRLKVPRESSLVLKDREASIPILGTTVADIRKMAFNHSKSEVAFVLGVTVGELTAALLAEDIEPIYFGYQCKKCNLSFQGEGALKGFRSHVLSCAK